jgi:hypothetical protein
MSETMDKNRMEKLLHMKFSHTHSEEKARVRLRLDTLRRIVKAIEADGASEIILSTSEGEDRATCTVYPQFIRENPHTGVYDPYYVVACIDKENVQRIKRVVKNADTETMVP